MEGFESQAFREGRKLLGANQGPDILFEFVDWAEAASGVSPGEAQAVLMSCGYSVHVLHNNSLSNAITTPVSKGAFMLYGTKRNL